MQRPSDHWTRRGALASLATLAAIPIFGRRRLPVAAATRNGTVVVYKRVGCMCCSKWVTHLESAGFEVRATEEADLDLIKDRLGVPTELRGCHTGVLQGYVFEGHVPADVISRVLEEKPAVAGLAVPGMPVGSPGMEVEGQGITPYEIFSFERDGSSAVFAKRG